MTTSAPCPSTVGGDKPTKRLGERSQHDYCRVRLPSEFPTNCLCRYRNWGTERAAARASGIGGSILPRAGEPRREGARGDGSQWTLALVRAPAGGVGYRAMAWGRGCDSSQARPTQAQDGSPGCPAHSAGSSLSAVTGPASSGMDSGKRLFAATHDEYLGRKTNFAVGRVRSEGFDDLAFEFRDLLFRKHGDFCAKLF